MFDDEQSARCPHPAAASRGGRVDRARAPPGLQRFFCPSIGAAHDAIHLPRLFPAAAPRPFARGGADPRLPRRHAPVDWIVAADWSAGGDPDDAPIAVERGATRVAVADPSIPTPLSPIDVLGIAALGTDVRD